MATPNDTTLLSSLGIEGLPPDEQEEMLLKLSEVVFKGSLVRMIEQMDEQTKDDFNELLDSDPDDEVVQAFLKERVPDADRIVEEAIQSLTSDILDVTGESQD
ncbi:MAG: hypothetical protein JWL75_305 [Parcubacteria group bacterium]|nr:hypothetical protein [Parcubacteria group bacterium]